jgi:hypothetical protein
LAASLAAFPITGCESNPIEENAPNTVEFTAGGSDVYCKVDPITLKLTGAMYLGQKVCNPRGCFGVQLQSFKYPPPGPVICRAGTSAGSPQYLLYCRFERVLVDRSKVRVGIPGQCPASG